MLNVDQKSKQEYSNYLERLYNIASSVIQMFKTNQNQQISFVQLISTSKKMVEEIQNRNFNLEKLYILKLRFCILFFDLIAKHPERNKPQYKHDIMSLQMKASIFISDIETIRKNGKLKEYFQNKNQIIQNKNNNIENKEIQKPGNSCNKIDSLLLELSNCKKEISNLKKEIETKEEQELCVICLENKKTIVFLDCGHLCTCESCSKNIKNCPLCRKEIGKQIKVFL